jgi:hypothetical protein
MKSIKSLISQIGLSTAVMVVALLGTPAVAFAHPTTMSAHTHTLTAHDHTQQTAHIKTISAHHTH